MLPKKVKIGGLFYDVEVVPGPLVDGGTVLFGQAVYADSKIRIAGNVSECQQECSLWHELLHVMGFERKLEQLYGANEEEVEALVVPLATALYAFMVDNGLKFPDEAA